MAQQRKPKTPIFDIGYATTFQFIKDKMEKGVIKTYDKAVDDSLRFENVLAFLHHYKDDKGLARTLTKKQKRELINLLDLMAMVSRRAELAGRLNLDQIYAKYKPDMDQINSKTINLFE